jgi:hypothetical protein
VSRVVDPEKVFVGRAARGPLTNWAKYCDGQAHELTAGEDWDDGVPIASKRSSFRQWGKRNGLNTQRMRTTIDGDTMVIYVEGGAFDVPGVRAQVRYMNHEAEAQKAELNGYPEAAKAWRAVAEYYGS